MKNKQKNITLLFSVVLLFVSCTKTEFNDELIKQEVQNISLEQATAIAVQFSGVQPLVQNSDNPQLKMNKQKKVKGTETFEDTDGEPAFFIVQFEPDGFVIVSGNKEITPILAFSENGFFSVNSQNVGLTEWLEFRKVKSKLLKDDKKNKIPKKVKEQWDALPPPPHEEDETVSGGTVAEQMGPYLTTNWGQGNGYNDQVPFMSCASPTNGHAPTGCVATATAQIMRYWQHPTTYSWTSMPNNSGSSETARLMSDIGDEIDMDYACGGSGAYTSDARDALVNDFSYSSTASYIDYNTDLVRANLNAQNPLIFRGTGNDGGHAWVCDGYRRNKTTTIHNHGTIYEYETYTYSPLFLHMNWGWGLLSGTNAWYLYNDFTPGTFNFNTGRKMIVNIHP